MKTIEVMLKEVALATTNVKSFGRGNRAYANLESKGYPRVWIHLVNPTDVLHQNNSITSVYEVVGEITKPIDLTVDHSNDELKAEKYLNDLEEIESIFIEYVLRLNKDSRNRTPIGQVVRKEIMHDYDDNLMGYVFTFTMNIIEKRTYPC